MLRIKWDKFSFIAVMSFTAIFFSASLHAQPVYSELVIFGDSLSDPGNAFVLTGEASIPPYDLIPDAPYARGGHHFTNGETWIEKLAKALHRNTGPALRTDKAFANYAIGGARARNAGPVNLTVEVGLYLSNSGGQVDDNALYTMFVGGNDLRDAIDALALDPNMGTSIQIIDEAVTAIYDNMFTLASLGAVNFLVVNGPDLSLVPAVLTQDPAVQGAAKFLSNYFNEELSAKLATLDGIFPITTKTVNIFVLFNTVAAVPVAFGFENANQSCITPGVVQQAACDKPDNYLFWDGIHPTRAGHQVIADTALKVLNQP
jgi:phospholipase/lecithinase/hemolysin